ncbi:MAG: Rnase Y domain-containing protein, partial [Acidobacteriota bacterium]|nr:Rnase Y domain-containing protein [Acidobacteriota bacterium]
MEFFTLAGIATFVAACAICAVWMVTRKRVAANTVARAQTEADQLLRDARREAETYKKELALTAKDQAHALLQPIHREPHKRRGELATLEQEFASTKHELTDRGRKASQTDAKLQEREKRVDENERRLAAAQQRCDELTKDH